MYTQRGRVLKAGITFLNASVAKFLDEEQKSVRTALGSPCISQQHQENREPPLWKCISFMYSP